MSKRSSRKLRIGIVGLGRIGWQFHCRTVGSHPDWQLVAAVDPAEDRRLEAEQTYGCRSFADLDAMLDEADLDAVTIATPTPFHKEHALAALKHGLHVMLEKPMATDLTQARAIARAAQKAGRVLTVYQPHRATAYFQQLQKIIATGKIGQVYHVRRAWCRFVRRDDWQSLTKFGGGMLNNYGAHCLDQTLALTGYDVKNVFCNLRRVASLGDAEDVVKIVYETRSGILGEIDINQATLANPHELEVYGTRGVITMDAGEFTIRTLSPGQLKSKSLDASLASRNREYPDDKVDFTTKVIKVDPGQGVDIYKDFARSVRTGRQPLVPATQTLEVMRIMDRCRKMSGRIVVTKLN